MITKTNKTGCTCVGELRLASIDVGFDLRDAGSRIELPLEFRSVGFTDADGETWLIEGSRREMIAELRKAGYRIVRKHKEHA